MFLLYAIPIGLLAGHALGGRTGNLGDIRFRLAWLAVLAYVAQSLLFVPRLGALADGLAPLLYVLTNITVLVAIIANRRIAGVPLIALGAALNLLVIVANGGYMPADRAAYAALGMTIDGYWNTAFLDRPALALLGDWIALPAWLPMANVISVGDILIGTGVAVTIALGMRAPRSAGLDAGAVPRLVPPGAAGTTGPVG